MSVSSTSEPLPASAYQPACSAAFAAASVPVDEEVLRRTALIVARLGKVLGQPTANEQAPVDFVSALESAA